MRTPFVTRLRAQNYKSVKACDLALGPLNILVGPNGSGKSNIVDALRFTADGLATTLDNAIRSRGGVNEVRRRSGGHPNTSPSAPTSPSTTAFAVTTASRSGLSPTVGSRSPTRSAGSAPASSVRRSSPDLLDRDDLGDDAILAVQARDGVTSVGPVDDAARQALRERLFAPGELLRMNQLAPLSA